MTNGRGPSQRSVIGFSKSVGIYNGCGQDTRKTPSEAEGMSGSRQRKVKILKAVGKAWENAYCAKDMVLKSEMNAYLESGSARGNSDQKPDKLHSASACRVLPSSKRRSPTSLVSCFPDPILLLLLIKAFFLKQSFPFQAVTFNPTHHANSVRPIVSYDHIWGKGTAYQNLIEHIE